MDKDKTIPPLSQTTVSGSVILPSDLRIGNYVTDEFFKDFKTFYEVLSINEKGINLYIEDDGNYPECAKTWIEPEWRLDVLKPIPLSDEWILKFKNIKKVNEWSYKYEDLLFEFLLQDRFLSIRKKIDAEKSVFLVDVEFVHTFQNVIFALTGSELHIVL